MDYRLFVDVDDTLILWGQGASGEVDGVYLEYPYRVNERLAAGIRWVLGHEPETQVVVWSGGGGEYTREMVTRAGLTGIMCLDKTEENLIALVRAVDVVVDDEPLGGRRTHGPLDWPVLSE